MQQACCASRLQRLPLGDKGNSLPSVDFAFCCACAYSFSSKYPATCQGPAHGKQESRYTHDWLRWSSKHVSCPGTRGGNVSPTWMEAIPTAHTIRSEDRERWTAREYHHSSRRSPRHHGISEAPGGCAPHLTQHRSSYRQADACDRPSCGPPTPTSPRRVRLDQYMNQAMLIPGYRSPARAQRGMTAFGSISHCLVSWF